MILDFVKEEDGRWFIELENWKGPKDALQMVAGADLMLEILSNYTNKVSLEVFTKEPRYMNRYESITYLASAEDVYGEGAFYSYNSIPDFKLWLCAVVLFIFDEYPKEIYFKVIKE